MVRKKKLKKKIVSQDNYCRKIYNDYCNYNLSLLIII